MLQAVHLLGERLPAIEPGQLASALSYALIFTAVVAEAVSLAARHGRHRVARLPVAARMAGGAIVSGAAVTFVYARAWPAALAVAPPGLERVWDAQPLVGATAAFVAWDGAGYLYHRIGHRTAVGWASHQVHHTGTQYDLSLAWRQSWFPVHALVVFPLVGLLGFDLAAVAVAAAASNVWQALLHTDRRLGVHPLLAAVVMTPATHRRHHTVDGGGVNLGPVLTVWDRLFGTWDPDPVPMAASYGIAGRADTDGATSLEIAGWRCLGVRRSGSG